MPTPDPARLRRRILAELTPSQQAAVEAFEEAFSLDVLATDRPLRTVIEDAAMAGLYDHYRGMGLSSLDAAYRAGDDVGISPSAARSRYYRSIRPDREAA